MLSALSLILPSTLYPYACLIFLSFILGAFFKCLIILRMRYNIAN